MASSPVGRDEAIDAAWHSLTTGVPVVVEGPAGIGKTVVWQALVDRAADAGRLVLTCAPTETETALPFAALDDVLRPLAGSLAQLPVPQRAAVEGVLLTGTPQQAVDERAVGAATRALLASVEGPVLLAVDDAPWLDPASERALRFALRRLPSDGPPVAVLVTRRIDDGPDPGLPLGLDDAPGRAAVRVPLGPLGVGALHHVVRARLGASLSRPLLARIAAEAHGNPLLAVEMARAVLRLPQPPRAGEDLPVPSSIRQLLGDTLATLPPATRDAVRLAALLAVPTPADLASAGVPSPALDAAEEAGLLAVTDRRVAFGHPLYASAVRAAIPPGVRRQLHRRLADAVPDPDERARQLARCATGPEAGVAAELEALADRQRRRGSPAVAADLYEQAAALTPAVDPADAARRVLAAVRCWFSAGDYPTASAAALAAAGRLDGEARGEALLLHAMVAYAADDIVAARDSGLQALGAVVPGGRLAATVHAHLAMFHDSPDDALAHAEQAIALLPADEEPQLLAATLLHVFHHEVRAGRPPRTELLDRALELEDGDPLPLAGTVPAIWWKGVDDHARARQRLELLAEHALAQGDEQWLHESLQHLAETELLAGRYGEARRHVTAARELGEQLGSGLVTETWLEGMLAAYQGRLADAEEVAVTGLARAEADGDPWAHRIHLQLLAFTQLSAGRAAEAAAGYGELAALQERSGVVESTGARSEADRVEACVAAGDPAGAVEALERLRERHERLPRPWTSLGLARSRVLLEAAGGADPAEAVAALEAALDAVPADVVPLDRARSLLVAGVAHRRGRRRRAARVALEAAVAAFDELGAAAFADRARAELARVGARPAPDGSLTPTEERVARLAAQGRTNRAIADALFISQKTVEANLARVYTKLGIANRAQLGGLLGDRAES